MSPYQRRIFSKASFDSPYGLIGFFGSASSIGTRSGGPKMAQVEEKTSWFTPVAIIASSRFNPLLILFRKYLRDSASIADEPAGGECITAAIETFERDRIVRSCEVRLQ